MDPAVVFNGTKHIVVWSDARFTGAYYWLVASCVSTDGVVLDTGYCIGAQQMRSELSPDIAFDSERARCFVVWYNFDPPFGVYGRLLDETGQPMDTAVTVAVTIAGFNVNPSVVFAGGQYFVVWADVRPGSSDLDIYGQFVSISGQPARARLLIATGPNNQMYPEVAYDGSALLVIWREETMAIFGQRISASGTMLGGNFPVSDTMPYYRYNAGVAASPANFLVAWSEIRDGETDIVGNVDVAALVQEQSVDRTERRGATVFRGDLVLPGAGDYGVYDVSGRGVTGRPIAGGIYFITLGDRIVQKMIKVK